MFETETTSAKPSFSRLYSDPLLHMGFHPEFRIIHFCIFSCWNKENANRVIFRSFWKKMKSCISRRILNNCNRKAKCTWGQELGCLSSLLFAISQYSLEDTFNRKVKSFLRWGVLLLKLPGTVKSKLVRLREQQEQGCSRHRQSPCCPSWCRPTTSESQNALDWRGPLKMI